MHISFSGLPISGKNKITRALEELNNVLSLSLDRIFIHACDENEITQLNIEYLNHNYPTDIITFDMRDQDENEAILYLGVETIKQNALDYNTSLNIEMYRVCLHGLLHLAGFNDKTPAEQEIMRNAENHYLKTLFHVKHL